MRLWPLLRCAKNEGMDRLEGTGDTVTVVHGVCLRLPRCVSSGPVVARLAVVAIDVNGVVKRARGVRDDLTDVNVNQRKFTRLESQAARTSARDDRLEMVARWAQTQANSIMGFAGMHTVL